MSHVLKENRVKSCDANRNISIEARHAWSVT